eukprot:CAMPEP_0116143792 /NCGR_PEP_ID=MMETSP0329-20121206/15640_1 /TAXON_ID=697910 /ORGANISM="Pseudo-nitzschia arenysensis, Strain B593" /LENGTH=1209 /DNA_ID=CAMNT_0003639137 /DNA_START=160 /DNA_END=3789 /DNA_ORIENTATION=+
MTAAYNEIEASAEMLINDNVDELTPSPRKRTSPLKSSSGNSRQKKQKLSSGPVDDYANDEKENNGRRPSPGSSLSQGHGSKQESGLDFLAGRNINQKNKPPEAGIITKIYAENFMCHRKLTVELSRNVNFIYGQNGSGKSAILAAIQICLGAGARRTNRARSLKDLIRKGTSSNCAKVRVTLLNKGSDAYEHDKYGDYITVERTIALRGGYNGYKLFSADNIEQSRQKKDLCEMLDKLNIQVENPVAILDQEEAKKFLTGKAEAKYNFFMKATELERLDNTYASTAEQVEVLNRQADRMARDIEKDKALVQKTKKAYQQHQAIGKLEGKKSKYELLLAWASFKLALQEQQDKEDSFAKFTAKAEKKKQELTQAEAISQSMNDPNEDRRDNLEALTNEATEMSDKKRDLEIELKEPQLRQKSTRRQIERMKDEERKIAASLLEANQRLQKKRDEIAAKAGSAQTDQARRNQRMQKAEETLNREKNRRNELKQAVTDSYNAYEEIEPEVHAAHQRVSQLQNQLRGIDSKIQSMQKSSGDSLHVFGHRCSSVKKLVNEAIKRGEFSGPVLGPIGLYCKIQPGKDNFATLAELAIGNGVLDRFIVFNNGDRKRFQQIRNQARCQMDCGIFQQHQHPRYRIPDLPQGVETVATVVSIQNDLVFNCLVDNAKIDTKALSRSKKESEDLLLVRDNNNRAGIRGGKIKEVYFLPKGDNWKVTKGNIQMISNTRRAKKTIGADVTAAINDAKNDYQSVNEELKVTKNDRDRLEREHTDHKTQWNSNKKALQKNEKEIDEATKKIENIKAEELASIDNNIDTTIEEEDVAEAQAALDEIKENQRRAADEIKEKAPKIQEIRDNLAEITSRNQKILKDIEQAQKELSDYFREVEIQKQKIEKKREKYRQFEAIAEEYGKEIATKTKETNEYLRFARHIQYTKTRAAQNRKQRADNFEVDEMQIPENNADPTEEELEMIEIPDLDQVESIQYYDDRIRLVNEKIEEEKERRLENGDDEPTAYAKYARALKTYEGKKKQIKEISSSVNHFYSDMDRRRKRWTEYRDTISDSSSSKFAEILNIKSSGGEIEFDHDDQTLNLIVQKDKDIEQSQQNDVKALSGGERSFTTISLLLAIGETLETPFRVMDEFDVFLDPVTRKKVIDQLVHVGTEMGHRQFIFITPQDVSNLTSSPTLKILQMKPPERQIIAGGHEQQTLDFSSQQ